MNTPDMSHLRSDRAIVAHRTVYGENCPTTVHCVVLADGTLLDCGSGVNAPLRAALLAEAVNTFGPEKFNFGGRR